MFDDVGQAVSPPAVDLRPGTSRLHQTTRASIWASSREEACSQPVHAPIGFSVTIVSGILPGSYRLYSPLCLATSEKKSDALFRHVR